MNERAEALAVRFEQRLGDLVDAIEKAPEPVWRANCADTGWPVNVQAHHLAVSAPALVELIHGLAAATPVAPLKVDAIDRLNAAHAREHADCARSETLVLLRRNGEIAATRIRRLSDEQLDRTAVAIEGWAPASVAQLVEIISIGEIERHGGAILQAIGG